MLLEIGRIPDDPFSAIFTDAATIGPTPYHVFVAFHGSSGERGRYAVNVELALGWRERFDKKRKVW
jgi:hypothetical protein